MSRSHQQAPEGGATLLEVRHQAPSPRHILHTDRRALKCTTIAAFAVLGAGCAWRSPHGPSAPTQVDRIMQAYRSVDIQRGRLLIIADFEDPRQMSLFSFAGASNEGKMILDPKKGRPETGTGCLLLTVGSAGDTVVVANTDQSDWYLKRDWRPYDLLMMSVYVPKDDLSLEVGIGSGLAEQRAYAYSSMPLARGWNLVRLDLAEVAEQIPLDDIREIRLGISGADRPLQVRFDDILLAGNRVDLHGDSANKVGGLYVQQAGRHLNIGTGGRFEISFANGQITNWYNLAADPYRLRNLVRGTTLGPSPVVVDESGTRLGDFSELGRSVASRQHIVEMSAVRVVVESEWRFVNEANAPLDRCPFQRWVYTIYPTGQIFVMVEATAETDSWSPRLALAATFSSTAEEQVQTRVGGGAGGSAGERTGEASGASTSADPIFAAARNAASDAILLFIPYPSDPNTRIVEHVDGERRRTSFLVLSDAPRSALRKWICQMFVATSSAVDESEIRFRAMDYTTRGSLRMEIGKLPASEKATMRGDGFDPGGGSFVVAVEQNRARLTLDGRERPTYSPAFVVVGGQSGQSWVYADNLIFEPITRRQGGDIVFQLPGIVRKKVMIETLFRHAE